MNSREEKNKEKQKKFDNMELQETIKNRFILFLKITVVVLLVILINVLYTKYISTLGIIVNEKPIYSNLISEDFSGVKVVQFSDLHYGSTIMLDEVKSLVKIINSRKPDIIVFTGDLIDENYKISLKEEEKLSHELQKLDASIGKYAVSGEEDEDSFLSILNQCNFNILDNSSDTVYESDKSSIRIVGISSAEQNQDVDAAFSNSDNNLFTIALVHEPDTADEIVENYRADLILAGHSHNGQVKIPGLEPIIRRKNAMKYPGEHYKLESSDLYVSSGIGCSDFNFRLGARPSINFFRLRRK